jgi:hypothetical protein
MMHPEDQDLVEQSLRQIIVTAAPGRLRDDIESFGWLELLREEPHVAVSVLFALQGKHLAATTMLDQVALAAFGLTANESASIGFVFPPTGTHQPTRAYEASKGLTLEAGGLVVARATAPERIAAIVRLDGDVILATGALRKRGPRTAQAWIPIAAGRAWTRV